jgi:hypothetical protein
MTVTGIGLAIAGHRRSETRTALLVAARSLGEKQDGAALWWSVFDAMTHCARPSEVLDRLGWTQCEPHRAEAREAVSLAMGTATSVLAPLVVSGGPAAATWTSDAPEVKGNTGRAMDATFRVLTALAWCSWGGNCPDSADGTAHAVSALRASEMWPS